MSQLCSSCSQIGIELPASEDVIKTRYWTVNQVLNSGNSSYWDRKPIGSFRIASRRSRAAHAESASDGCLLCQLLCYGAEKLKGNFDLNFNCYHNGKGRDGLLPEELKPHYDICAVRLTFQSTLRPLPPPGVKEEKIQNLWFDAHTDEDDPAARYISSRRIDPQVASAKSFQRAKAWLGSCTQARESHSQCPRYATPQLPARVIDVSSLDPRIVASKGQQGNYVALSYCWGGPQLNATTRRNIHSRLKGFKLSTLPWTLRDAVKVTRQLGLRFLWVDSMCILQDSPADKEVEMAKMCQIYKNSFVTIIAGSSRSCNEGFLQDRLSRHPTLVSASEAIEPEIPSIYNTSGLNLPYRCPDGSLGTLSLTKSASLSPIWDEKDEPIYRRAWALQERFLSPRVLLYASDRLVFRCQNSYIMNGTSSDGYAMPPELLDPVFFSCSPPPQSEFANGSMYLFKSWSSIVESYARCELTVAADKLPGLSGLAEEYERLTGDHYRAGLWLSALPGALVWKSIGEGSRVSVYRAPSWSWASLDGDIQMSQIETTEDIELIDCQVSLKSNRALFGEVTNGVVVLKGRLMKAKLSAHKHRRCTMDISWWPRRPPDPDWELYEPDRRHFRSEFPPDNAIGTITFDTSEDAESGCPFWFLKLYVVPDKIMVGGLALTPVRLGCFTRRFHSRTKTFRRVGTFLMDYYQEDCFQYTKPETVRII